MDIFFISPKKVKHKFRAGLVCINVLSTFAVVVPVKTKVTNSVVKGKKPKIIYSDDKKVMQAMISGNGWKSKSIELYRTRGHPAFAKRFIKTFKDK